MQRTFLTNLILVLVLNVLIKPFYILGIDAEVLKQVESTSPGDYGEYFSLLGLTFILNIFLDLGITNFNTRNIAQNSQLLRKHFSQILTLRAILSFGYIGLIFIAGLLLGYEVKQFKWLGILAFNQILVSFILYFRSNLSGLLLFKQDSIISVLDRLLLIIICSVLLWGGVTQQAFKIEWFIIAQTVSYAITALIAGLLVLRKTGKLKPKFNITFSRMIIKKSLPYAVLILLMMIYYRSDSVMLERMLPNGKEEAAVYARGYRFFEALNMVGYLFAGLLLPIFSKLLKKKENVSDMLSLSFKLILLYSVTFGVSAFFFREEIMGWRFQISGDELLQTGKTFGLLMFCFISFTMTYIFGTLLTANGNLKALNLIAGASVLVNIIINLFLIPEHGAYGAAIASLFTQLVTAIAQVILVYRLLPVSISTRDALSIILFPVVFIALCFGAGYVDLHWSVKFVSILVCGGLIGLFTGMISIKGISRILQS
jgi:O-antigen/teichoic acid export membrane protein